MTCLPTPVIVPYKPPSPEARELSERLTAVIEEYQRGRPGLDACHIEQALQIAAAKVEGASSIRPKVLMVLALLVLTGALAASLYLRAPISSLSIPGMIVGVLVFLFLVALIRRHGN